MKFSNAFLLKFGRLFIIKHLVAIVSFKKNKILAFWENWFCHFFTRLMVALVEELILWVPYSIISVLSLIAHAYLVDICCVPSLRSQPYIHPYFQILSQISFWELPVLSQHWYKVSLFICINGLMKVAWVNKEKTNVSSHDFIQSQFIGCWLLKKKGN